MYPYLFHLRCCSYVTPEQLVKGNALRQMLQFLRSRGRFARIVIDEVSMDFQAN